MTPHSTCIHAYVSMTPPGANNSPSSINSYYSTRLVYSMRAHANANICGTTSIIIILTCHVVSYNNLLFGKSICPPWLFMLVKIDHVITLTIFTISMVYVRNELAPPLFLLARVRREEGLARQTGARYVQWCAHDPFPFPPRM